MLLSTFSATIRYLTRLAREVGYLNFGYRYLLRRFYKLIKVNQKIVLFNDVEMTLPWNSRFATELFLKGTRLDWGSEVLLTKFLDKGKSFIDVGANIGYYSLLAAPLSDTVYVFEPDRRIIKDLEENLSQFPNIKIIQEALYSEPGSMEFSLSTMSELNSLVKTASKGEKVLVKVNTLDNLMLDYPSLSVSCIKTDAEGVDFDILLGGKNLLIRDQPLVLSELYPNSKLLKFIKSIGFSCFAFAKPKDKVKYYLPPKFMKIESKPVNVQLKMIFLVPGRLLLEFEKLIDD
ncbi:MAG: FkbM family methyltransferase [Okeania sp. SIO3B5]|uniref:FkbM family methyltransferase n=1 Tax=Okeania sp. SIO3B5 TaxID=2607811 RepID=UPI00140106E1|nr:FkbM family methyltransferase [Okeania sp. SIO3B5]NEO51621.1 FkbM family methyltransferase [Okeania sp. SIO3B5]